MLNERTAKVRVQDAPPLGEQLIHAAGEMAGRIRRFPWETTPLGAMTGWSETLLCTVNTILESQFPMLLAWGPEMVQFYNDACIPLNGGKHPQALGQSARDCWSEAWHVVGPRFESVMAGGERFFFENDLIPVVRHGVLTDVYWTYSYSPVRDPTGTVCAILVVSQDVTARLAAERERDAMAASLRNVVESTTDGLATLDKQWRYTFVNRQGARLVRMRPEEMIGKPVWELFPHAAVTEFAREARQAERTGQPRHFDTFYPDPLNVWLECHCYPSEHGLSVYFRDVTEQRQTEKALRASESRFRKLFESDLMGIGIPNRSGGFHECNDELLRIVGYTREDFDAGRVRWDALTPPEYRALDAAHIAEADARGSCTPYRKEYIGKDGARVPIMCGYALLEGSEDRYIGFVLDLTLQKQTEAALREREERFRALADSLPQLVWMSDTKGITTYCNRRVAEYFGIHEGELNEFSWRPHFHPEDVDRVFAAWWHSVETQEPFQVEYRLRRHDGQYRTFLVRALPVRNEAGEVDRWIGASTDIHDQKLTEDALREREQRFRVLAESLPQLVWMRDAGGQYIYCNQRLLDYVGLPAEWLGRQDWEAVHPDDVARTLENWKLSIETGAPYENEYRLRRHDGVYRWFLARGVPIRDEAGHILRWLGSSTDIEDRKLAEDALRRTEKLTTAGRFAASMAHEINNPLNAVVNLLFLALGDRELSESTRSLLATADSELSRVGQYVTQSLRFHKQSTAPSDTDLSETMDSVLAMYEFRFRSSGILLQRQYRTRERLHCFQSELRQVFANLVGNALDATAEQGRIQVRIRASRSWTEPTRRGIRVLVADSGAGIPTGMRGRIFEPFVSTKESTGVGLGLWVSQGIVHQHQGRITLRSSTHPARHGTVFSVFLPFPAAD